MSMVDHTLKPEAMRRLEVITGPGRRRRFSKDDKARIVEETLAPGAVVSEVARRHGLSPQQLFGWRRQARQPLEATAGGDARLFVPAVVDAPLPARAVHRRDRNRPRHAGLTGGVIEIEIDDVTVRISGGVDSNTVAAVIHALKAGS